MRIKATRAASGATLLLALTLLCACVPDSPDIPEPTRQTPDAVQSPAAAIRVVTVSDMATTAVRVDERSASSPTRTLARRGFHYYDVILSVPTAFIDGPASSQIGAPVLRVGGAGFPIVDSVMRRRAGAKSVHLILEFEVPLDSRPESIHVPLGKSGEKGILLPLRPPPMEQVHRPNAVSGYSAQSVNVWLKRNVCGGLRATLRG